MNAPVASVFPVRLQRLFKWTLLFGFPSLYFAIGYFYVNRESGAIYTCDHATFWIHTINLWQAFKSTASLGSIASSIYQATGVQDYNPLAAIPLALTQSLSQNSRAVFIGTICGLYGGLIFLAIHALLSKVSEERFQIRQVALSGLITAGFTPLWISMVQGFIEALPVGLTLWAVFLLHPLPEASKRGWLKLLSAGALLILATVVRRTFAFYPLAIGIITAASLVVAWIRSREFRPLFPKLQSLALVALGGIAVYVVFPAFFLKSLNLDKAAQTGWRSTASLPLQFWWHIILYLGPAFLTAQVCAVWILWKKRRDYIAILIATGATYLALVLHMRTALPLQQHRALLAVAYLTSVGLAVMECFKQPGGHVRRSLPWLACLVAAAGLTDVIGWAPPDFDSRPRSAFEFEQAPAARPAWWRALLGRTSPPPFIREDLSEMQRLFQRLDSLSQSDANARIYFLSSSPTLMQETVMFSTLPSPGLKFAGIAKMLATHQVDSRDGRPQNLLGATLVVVPVPLQIHLEPRAQTAIIAPWKAFQENRGISKAFEELPDEFSLEKGVRVKIFRRLRPNTQTEVNELIADLEQLTKS